MLDYFEPGSNEEEIICKDCNAPVSNDSSHMFHHLMKKHPALYKEAKMQARSPNSNPLCKVEDGEVKEEKPQLLYCTQPKEAILHFMEDQIESYLPYDARLQCSEGSVHIHRLVLASVSPMLAVLMQENTEEEESIYVEGTSLAALSHLKQFLYKGGRPSEECEALIAIMNIRPDGISSHYVRMKEAPERRSSVKQEPLDYLRGFEASMYEPVTGLSISKVGMEDNEKTSLHDYFTEVETELYQCLVCDEAELELISEENLRDHLAKHPLQWEKIQDFWKKPRSKLDIKRDISLLQAELFDTGDMEQDELDDDDEDYEEKPRKIKKPRKKKKLRSKIWYYFDSVDEGVSQCKECNKKIITNKNSKGSTSGLINHLRHAHPHLFDAFQAIKKESGLGMKEEFGQIAAVKLEGGMVDTLPDVKIKPKKIKSKEGKERKKKGCKRSRIWAFYTSIGEGVAKCNSCSQTCNLDQGSTSNMIYHLKRNHTAQYNEFEGMAEAKPEMVMCEYCSETYDNRKMLEHNFNNHYESWHETVLNRFTVIKQKLFDKQSGGPAYRHLLTFFKPSEDGRLSCRRCSAILTSDKLTTMEQHLNCVHPDLETLSSMSLGRWILFTWVAGEGGSCQVCGTLFHSEEAFNVHIAESHKIERAEVVDWEEVLESPGEPLSFKTALLVEKYEKTGGYWQTGSKQQLRDLAKMDDPVFRTCGECRKIFSTSSAMRYHHRVVHSGERPYKCDFCEKSYNRKDTLDSHLATHSDLKEYICSVCGKQFGRRHIRDTHERRHRGEKKHGCTYCNKRFMSGQQLKNHIRVHTGEKPFSCEHCGRMFAVKHQLVTHLRIHTGERPYGCSKCDQKFKHLSTRRNHKCVGDMKSDPISLDPREQLYRIPIPPVYQSGL